MIIRKLEQNDHGKTRELWHFFAINREFVIENDEKIID